ncbi:MurR/RpiR family transcriptional regulator [Streptomyces cadmiisoli]|uniref:MurR/RpiR family transcriptional regulator n=1 Tax=Streptomyces cadmiisoli TaxID=2184053 RepID=UPI003D73F06D
MEVLARAREVLAFGVGLSEIPARFLAMKMNRLGHPTRFVGATGFLLADGLLGLRENDAVVIYAPARLTRELGVVIDHAQSVGAKTVLVTDSLGPAPAGRVDVTLPAVHSATGYTAEAFSSLLITDCLLLGVAARYRDRSTSHSELLHTLRAALTPESHPTGRQPTRRRASQEDGS